ncbi:integrase, catalytic region, zinc finger, CCHC-type containing protein, partial [Tanacetum coccineum]
TPQQNGVVERRNRTLVEAARTMLIFSKAVLHFLLIEKKGDFSYLESFCGVLRLLFFHTFFSLPRDSEDLGNFQAKADIGIFIGYAPSRKGYRIYNKKTRVSDNGSFNEPVPSATKVNAQVVPPSTSLSTMIAQDAPSTSASLSTSDMHHPVRHQGIAKEPTHEDSPITHDVLHPLFNPVTGEPGS